MDRVIDFNDMSNPTINLQLYGINYFNQIIMIFKKIYFQS